MSTQEQFTSQKNPINAVILSKISTSETFLGIPTTSYCCVNDSVCQLVIWTKITNKLDRFPWTFVQTRGTQSRMENDW